MAIRSEDRVDGTHQGARREQPQRLGAVGGQEGDAPDVVDVGRSMPGHVLGERTIHERAQLGEEVPVDDPCGGGRSEGLDLLTHLGGELGTRIEQRDHGGAGGRRGELDGVHRGQARSTGVGHVPGSHRPVRCAP
ncbi:MAG: hypothetical protein R2702_11505 [Acidimicrobiales bacterium]